MIRSLTSAGREAFAMVRQATLLHRDLRVVRPLAPSGDVVVLVHGFLATAGVLRPLRERIEQDTLAATASFTHLPGLGLEMIAQRLAELVRSLEAPYARIHLVGHSIGGLAARWFVSELGGDPRVVQTISIASPFSGAPRARFFPGRLARELQPGSASLGCFHERRAGRVPHFSVAAGRDRVVPKGALLASGDGLIVDDAGHNAVLYHPLTLDAVVARIRRFVPAGASAPQGVG